MNRSPTWRPTNAAQPCDADNDTARAPPPSSRSVGKDAVTMICQSRHRVVAPLLRTPVTVTWRCRCHDSLSARSALPWLRILWGSARSALPRTIGTTARAGHPEPNTISAAAIIDGVLASFCSRSTTHGVGCHH